MTIDPTHAGRRQSVTVNRRVDILAHELAQSRIAKHEFMTGRLLQAAWERQSGANVPGADMFGSGGQSYTLDGLTSSEIRTVRLIVAAKSAEEMNTRVRNIVGDAGAHELRAILCGSGYFADHARASGSTGDRAIAEIGQRFRWLLRQVAEAFLSAQWDRPQAVKDVEADE